MKHAYKYDNGYLVYDRETNRITFEADNKNISELSQKENMIVLADEIKKEVVDVKRNRNLKEVQITYISTPKCNLKCKYCYEAKGDDMLKLSPITGNDHYKVFKAVQNYYPKAKVTTCFFGGEPLLEKKAIFEFVDILNKELKEGKIRKPTIGTITNGTLLDGEIRQLIYDNFDALTVSIDGTKILHDANRVYKSGKGSFDDIVNNIKMLNEINKDKKVKTACEITVTDAYIENYNNNLIKDVFNLVSELKFDIVEFIVVIDENSKYINKEENIGMIAKDIVETWYEKFLHDEDVFRMSSLIDNMSLLIGDKVNLKEECAAGKSYFGVDSNKNIYPCQVSIFTDKNIIGKIENDTLDFNRENVKRYLQKHEHPICKECVCMKSCGSYCQVLMNDVTDQVPNGCLFNRKIFEHSITKIIEILNSSEKELFVNKVKKLVSSDE